MDDSDVAESPRRGEELSDNEAQEAPRSAGRVDDPDTFLPPKLTKKKLEKLQEQYNKRGIVYMSRLPPHLKPRKLRQMLEPHGEIGRIYLAPEDVGQRRLRKQKGSNSGKNFTEGWIEFEDKKDAKKAVAMLHGQQMGGKRRSAYFYDLWSLRYLPKFKWDQLTEEINYQKAVKDQRLAMEVAAAKRERDFYLQQVDAAKAQAAMQERREKKAKLAAEEGGADAGASGAGAAEPGVAPPERKVRKFGQRKAQADPVSAPGAPVVSRALLQMLAGQRDGAPAAGPGDP